MKGLLKKVRENKKGFTLAELLVVVAIVGILVAISIPVFTAQLSKARKATNQANLRAAKAAAVAQYLTDVDNTASNKYYNYSIEKGSVTEVDSENDMTAKVEVTDFDKVSSAKKYEKISVKIESSDAATTDTTLNGATITLYGDQAQDNK